MMDSQLSDCMHQGQAQGWVKLAAVAAINHYSGYITSFP